MDPTKNFKCKLEYENWLENCLQERSNGLEIIDAINKILSSISSKYGQELDCDLICRLHERAILQARCFIQDEDYAVLHHCVRLILTLEKQYDAILIDFRKKSEEKVEQLQTFQVLCSIVNDANCPARTTNLAGIALAFFFHTFSNNLDALKTLLINGNLSLEKEIKLFGGGHVCIIHGLLICGRNQILLSLDEKKQLLVFQLLPIVLGYCYDKQTNGYHSFTTLLAWLTYVKDNLEEIQQLLSLSEPQFGQCSSFATNILQVLDLNWTCPVEGVPPLVNQCFDRFIELHLKEAKLTNSAFLDLLLRRATNESCNAKSKYSQLGVLIKHQSIKKLLTDYPNFMVDLSMSWASNYLASASSDVYYALLERFHTQNSHKSQNSVIKKWRANLLPTLMFGLCHTNSIIRKNVTRYYLVYTLKILPFTFDELCESLQTKKSTESYLALASIFHLARSQGIFTVTHLNSYQKLLLFCLHHSDELVRLETFSFLCNSAKKSESLADLEIDLLRQFIPLNLNIDNAAFRQLVLSSFRSLLVRVRDSSIAMFKLLKKDKSVETNLNKTIEFMDWLLNAVIHNLRFGGCYQRRHTCLKMLSAILHVWGLNVDKNCKKERSPVATSELVVYLNSRGKCQFLSESVQNVLMICLLDYMDEIKELAFELIVEYVLTNIVINTDELYNFGLKLCRSPKTTHCESGAVLFHLLFCKLDGFDKQQIFVEGILKVLKCQFETLQCDILQGARDTPTHGLVVVLRRVFTEISKMRKCEEFYNWRKLTALIVNEISDIVKFILNVLAGKSNCASTPSFADMGEAVENLTAAECHQSQLSKEYQLILACLWLTLKNCCLLLGELVNIFPLQMECGEQYLLSTQQVSDIGSLLSNVLLRCRHRGVIESCCLSFELFCQKLVICGPHYFALVAKMLDKCLADIVSIASITSVTRRSAGFPDYITAIVTSQNQGEKRLLQHALTQLLQMVNEPLSNEMNDLVDVPQAHALHILKALVHDSRSSPSLFFKLDQILISCLTCFDLASWAVRNAALQLFGTVVSRLLGQKKVSDEHSTYNNVSMDEFFRRWPNLQHFLLNKLEEVNVKSPTSIVFPILSLLGRLTPSSNQKDAGRDDKFRKTILPLLSCPIWSIRRMAAKAVQAFLSPCNVLEHVNYLLHNLNSPVWNCVDGSLYCLKLSLQWQSNDVDFEKIRNLCTSFVRSTNIPDVVKVTAVQVLSIINEDLTQFMEMKTNQSKDKLNFMPGNCLWREFVDCWHLNSDWNSFKKSHLLQFVQREDKLITIINFFKNELEKNTKTNKEQWIWLQNCMTRVLDINLSFSIMLSMLQLMVAIYRKTNAQFDDENCENVIEFCVQLVTKYQSAILVANCVAVWAVALKSAATHRAVMEVDLWCTWVQRMSSPQLNEDCRLLAAVALTIGEADIFNLAKGSSIIKILDTAFDLLQDEEIEVRKEAANFVCKLQQEQQILQNSIHPSYAIQILCDFMVTFLHSNDEIKEFLWNKIGGDVKMERVFKENWIDESNVQLFEQEEVNVYAEKCFMSEIYSHTLMGNYTFF